MPKEACLFDEAQQVSQNASFQKAVLKMTLTRGSGGRGYQPSSEMVPNRVVHLFPFPEYSKAYWHTGIHCGVSPVPLYPNPLLAGLKHLSRLEHVLGARTIQSPAVEALLCDPDEHLIEGTKTNIFVVKNAQILTPTLDKCGVNGVVRQWLIEHAVALGLDRVDTCTLNLATFYQADEAFLTNSVIGAWPIQTCETHRFEVGPVTRRVQKALLNIGLGESV